MEPQKIEIMGIVKEEDLYRKRRTQDSNYEECSFQLECSFIEKIWCSTFVPHMRKGCKVKVIGVRGNKSNSIIAESVEMIKEEPPKLKGNQLKLFDS